MFDSFDWNENAKDFSELEFTIDGEYEIEDFNSWLKGNFPKEYEILRSLSNGQFWGSGFEEYVISCMLNHVMGDGIYPEYNVQLIKFSNAKFIS